VSLVVVVFGACSNDPPAKAPDNAGATVTGDTLTTPASGSSDGGTGAGGWPTTSATQTSALETTPSNSAASTDRMPSDSSATALSDEQILEITHVANQGEIEQAKLAQSKGKDARVKRLAAMMAKDHTDADMKGIAVEKKENINPAPSPTSTALEDGAKSVARSLKDRTGTDFDVTYLDTQVKEHQEVLDTIDQKLVPNAHNASVKAYLAEVRPKIAMHLKHARDLQKQMEN
jgi:putative membrane protein